MVSFLYCNCVCYCRYYLERSNSAKITFKRAVEIFPIEVSSCCVFSYRAHLILCTVELVFSLGFSFWHLCCSYHNNINL